jgi:hypothetical protein
VFTARYDQTLVFFINTGKNTFFSILPFQSVD